MSCITADLPTIATSLLYDYQRPTRHNCRYGHRVQVLLGVSPLEHGPGNVRVLVYTADAPLALNGRELDPEATRFSILQVPSHSQAILLGSLMLVMLHSSDALQYASIYAPRFPARRRLPYRLTPFRCTRKLICQAYLAHTSYTLI